MALVLYVVVALALMFAWSRVVQRVTWGAALVLLLLPLTFTGRAILTNRVYSPIDLPYAYEPLRSHAPQSLHDIALSDIHCQIIPWQKAVRYALSHGQWPLWNPFILCGDVLAASAQPAVYDPFTLVSFVLPLPLALTFGATLTFFLAAFFTYAFARDANRGELASLIAAAAYAFCGMMAFFVAWPLGRSWAFLPLVLLGARRVVHERKAGVLLLGFVLTIVAGHPESVLHVVTVGAAYGLFEWSRTRSMRSIALAAGAGAIALLLTAVYLLPFFEAASQTVEHDLRAQLYAPVPYGELISAERREHRIGRTFLPFFDGQPWRGETSEQWDPLSARAGSIVLALAIAGIIAAPRRGETWFWAAIALAGMNAAFGAWPVAHLLHSLPLFDITINERLAFAAAFAMAMLAATAIDALDRRTAGVMIVVAIALGIGTFATRHTAAVTVAELAPLVVIAALLLFRVDARIAILALLLIQRSIVDGSIYPALPRSMFYPRVAPLNAIATDGMFRIAGTGTTLVPNAAAMYELEDVRGYEAMTFRRLAQTYPLWSHFQVAWFNRIDDATRPFLSFLNVRYVLDGTRLIENKDALPRAFVPPLVRYERDSAAVLDAMQQATEFASRAWIEVAGYVPQDAENGPGTVAIRRRGLGFELDATMQRGGWVVISETAWQGWRAYVDGNRVRTHFANHAFLGVHVPAGRHRVRLVYLPESFTRGRTISLVTLALLCVALLRKIVR